MNLRSGKVSQYQPMVTKGFNVKSRADPPDPANILISSNDAVQALGRSYGVGVLSAELGVPAVLANAYFYEGILTRYIQLGAIRAKSAVLEFRGQYLLLAYGDDYLYYAQAPLDTRTQRKNAAKPKPDAVFADSGVDHLDIEVQYTSPVTHGSETPSRDTAMGGSALNYARNMFDREWAEARRWEWLHIVGHALGGNNEVGNLVAGTFDANTHMIPFERQVRDLSQTATAMKPLIVRYQVNLYPETWLAMDLQMSYMCSEKTMSWVTFHATSTLCSDKLQYDIWSM